MIRKYSLAKDGAKLLAPDFKVRELRCRDGSDTVMVDDALMLLQKAGEIRGLKLQVRYCLQEAYTTFEGERVKSIDYIADFVYERRTAPDSYGQRYWLPVVEDVKGMRNREYAMKAKLFRSRYGFAIREV